MIREEEVLVCSVHSGLPDYDKDTVQSYMEAVNPMLLSAKRYGIDAQLFWSGVPIKSYLDIRINFLKQKLEEADKKYKYAICVDSNDVLFLNSLRNILDDYEFLTDGILMCANTECFFEHKMDIFPKAENGYSFLESGAYIGPIDQIVSLLEMVLKRFEISEFSHDDKFAQEKVIAEIMLSGEADIKIDSECNIFQQNTYMSMVDLDVDHESYPLRNVITGNFPSIIHGGNQRSFAFKMIEKKIHGKPYKSMSTLSSFAEILNVNMINNRRAYFEWFIRREKESFRLTKCRMSFMAKKGIALFDFIDLEGKFPVSLIFKEDGECIIVLSNYGENVKSVKIPFDDIDINGFYFDFFHTNKEGNLSNVGIKIFNNSKLILENETDFNGEITKLWRGPVL